MTKRQRLLTSIDEAEHCLDDADHCLSALSGYRDRPSVHNALARLEETKLWVAHARATIAHEPDADEDPMIVIPVTKD